MSGSAETGAWPRGGRGPLLPIGLAPLAAYSVALLLVPTAILVVYSVWEASFFDVVRDFTLANYTQIFETPVYRELLLKSLGIGLAASTLIVVCGFVIAYGITFNFGTSGPRLLALVTASMLASYIVRIYAWKTILGTGGIVNSSLLGLGVISEPLTFLLYGYFAIILTLVYVYLPLAVLPIYAGLQDIDRRVLEAARDLGSSPLRVFRDVTLPLARPAIRTAFALSFILTAADYVTANLVGGTSGQMLGATIFYQFGSASNFPLGSALAVTMVAGFGVMFLLLRLGEWSLSALWRRRPRRHREPRRSRRLAGLRARLPRFSFTRVATIGLVGFLYAPLAVVLAFSFNDSVVPGIPFKGFTLRWYGDALGDPGFRSAAETSATVAVAAVGLALLVGVPAAYALARRRVRMRGLYETLVYGPAAIPGVVIGVALLTTCVFARIRLGVWPTVLAHALVVLPFVILVVRARLVTMDARMGEAARDLGARPARVLRTIDLPLLTPSLLGAGIVAGAISLDNVVVTNFTIGASATIPTWIYGRMQTGLNPGLNVVAVFMLVVPLALIGLVALVMRHRAGRVALTKAIVEA